MGANAQISRSLPEYGDDVGIHNCSAHGATSPSLRNRGSTKRVYVDHNRRRIAVLTVQTVCLSFIQLLHLMWFRFFSSG